MDDKETEEISLQHLYDAMKRYDSKIDKLTTCMVGDQTATPPIDGIVQQCGRHNRYFAIIFKLSWIFTPMLAAGLVAIYFK